MPRPVTSVQREIKQRKPFRSASQEAFIALLRTADLLRRRVSTDIEAEGITLQQYNVLRILRGAGDEGVPTLEVSDRMIEQAPGVTRLLDRLEAKELIRRQRCEKDRRQHLCWIAPKGLALLEQIDATTSRAHEDSLKGLRQKDRAAFIRMLDAIRAAHQ